jgi:glycosyltransferase involved in cell wall biosynthesis
MMPSPRVLFVNHTSTISGAEMVLLDVAPSCDGAGAFLFEEGPLSLSLKGLGVEVTNSRYGSGLSRVKRSSSLKKALPLAGRMSVLIAELGVMASRYDVLYANSQKAFVLGAAAAAIARRPLIWHLHDIISEAHFGSGQRLLQSTLANRFARLVVAPSQPVKSAFVAAGGRADLIRVVPNGLSADGGNLPRAELRRELGLPSKPTIGVFSRLAPWKGQHVVLHALARLPDAHCIIAGSALFGEDEYEQSLRALAARLNIADRVGFLGQRADIPRLMRAVDIVVHPSVDPEPFGRTIVEAMQVGTPVIATDAGASSEILARGEAGVLVPPGNERALAAAVRNMLACPPAALDAQVNRARTRARDVYSVAAMQRAIVDLIGEAAAKRLQ